MLSDFDIGSLSVAGPKIIVSTTEEFHDAVETLSAGSGGTIQLTSGFPADHLQIHTQGPESGEILIVPETPDDAPTLWGMRFIDSQNFTVAGFDFNSEDAVREEWLMDLMTQGSENLAFHGNTFTGTATGLLTNPDDTVESAVSIRDSIGIDFTDNFLSGYTHTLSFRDVQQVNVQGNEVTQGQGDALHGGGWQDMLIEGNYFHDMYGAYHDVSHSDFIQLWGRSTTLVSENVTIRGNILDTGDGPAYQGIFVRHLIDVDESWYHKNLVIEDNIIHSAMFNGIRVSSVDSPTIQNNTLLWNQDSALNVNAAHVDSTAPHITVDGIGEWTILDNIAPGYSFPEGREYPDNATINYVDQTDPDYIDRHFVLANTGGHLELIDIELLPDSAWVGEYGAQLSQPSLTADGVQAVMAQSYVGGDRGALVLDASLSRDETGYLDESEATFTWHFEDGSTLEGIRVVKDFGEDGGEHPVGLTVTRKSDDESSEIERDVNVLGTRILDEDFNAPLGDGYSVVDGGPDSYVDGFEGGGFRVDQESTITIDKDNVQFDLESFSLEMHLSKDSADATGDILYQINHMFMAVNAENQLTFKLYTDEGVFSLNSGDMLVEDTDWHQFNVVFDDESGSLTMYIDGEEADSTAASGTTASIGGYSLMVGAPGHRDIIEGVVDNLTMDSEPIDAEQVAARYQAHMDGTAIPGSDDDDLSGSNPDDVEPVEPDEPAEPETPPVAPPSEPTGPEVEEEEEEPTAPEEETASDDGGGFNLFSMIFEFFARLFQFGRGSDEESASSALEESAETSLEIMFPGMDQLPEDDIYDDGEEPDEELDEWAA